MLRRSGDARSVAMPRGAGASPSTRRRAFGFMIEAMERVRHRRALADLDDRVLRDIGLKRVDVWLEVEKPFWR